MKREKKEPCTAIVLSAGQGRRIGGPVQKQYIELNGMPVIAYSLLAFQKAEMIDEVILVVGEGQEAYARTEIIEKYGLTKVSAVVPGGKERYDSVWQGLLAIQGPEDGYVFIHDGARPFLDGAILERGYEAVRSHQACAAGMPSKDTVKLADENTFAVKTPERKYVWTIQTPQIFRRSLITEAYSRLMRESCISVTDDAMVVERELGVPVKLFEGAYSNIKITTPEDLEIAKVFLKGKNILKY